MVNANRGVPDPPNNSTDNNLTPNNEIITGTDSDSENEINDYEGYQPLPGNAEDAFSEEESDEEEGAACSSAPSTKDLSPIVTMEESLLKEVWSCGASKDIEMDSTKVDAVKRAMLSVTLPDSSIPEWANTVPEEEWKASLLSRIQTNNNRK